jgi:hypothetical protein
LTQPVRPRASEAISHQRLPSNLAVEDSDVGAALAGLILETMIEIDEAGLPTDD